MAGDVDARYPGSESAAEVVARVRPVLDAIADAHRGEAVLVVAHGGVDRRDAGGARLPAGPHADFPNCAYVELEGDATGWRLVRQA